MGGFVYDVIPAMSGRSKLFTCFKNVLNKYIQIIK